MLVLTRRPGEAVQISTDITVTVLEVTGNRIRIGINAPTPIPIVRAEPHRSEVELPDSLAARSEDA